MSHLWWSLVHKLSQLPMGLILLFSFFSIAALVICVLWFLTESGFWEWLEEQTDEDFWLNGRQFHGL